MQFGVSEPRACRVFGQPKIDPAPGCECDTDDKLALRSFLRDSPAVVRVGTGGGPHGRQSCRLKGQFQARPPPLDRKRVKLLRGIGQAMGPFWAIGAMSCGLSTSSSTTLRRADAQDPQRPRRVHPRGPRHRRGACPSTWTASSPASNAWQPSAAHFSTSASTTGPSSLPTRWPTVAASTAPGLSSSIPAARGRTLGSRASTDGCNEHRNGRGVRLVARGSGAHRGLEDRLQHEQAASGVRLAHPGGVRREVAPPTAAAARIVSGSTIGTRSN